MVQDGVCQNPQSNWTDHLNLEAVQREKDMFKAIVGKPWEDLQRISVFCFVVYSQNCLRVIK